MAFGNASLPTRKYVLGAREFLPRPVPAPDAPESAPGSRPPRDRFEGHDRAVDQLFYAHWYQNDLIRVERERRTASSDIVHGAFSELVSLLATAEVLQAELETLRARVQLLKVQTGRRKPDRELAAVTKAKAAQAAPAWAAYKALKKVAYADPSVRADLDATELRARALANGYRDSAIANGLYWGTSLLIPGRIDKSGAPPEVKPFTGEGIIGVQFQRKPDTSTPKTPVLDKAGKPRIHPRSGQPTMRHEGGSSLRTDDIFKPNSLCWIEKTDHPKHVTVHFRVGSGPSGGPIWARLPAVLHRPFPAGAEIKWAYLSRRKVGTHFKWEVQFDVAASGPAWTTHDGLRDAARKGNSPLASGRSEHNTVAVALGWRKIGDTIRVAVWQGSDGQSGEITIPADRLAAWTYCDTLQSIRDNQFNDDVGAVRHFLSSLTEPLSPEWAARTHAIGQWKSQYRLASLVTWWRSHRLPGDEAVFARVEGELVPALRDESGRKLDHDRYTGGRKQWKHLLDWSEHRRLKCRNWRKHFYRHAALELASMYKSVVVAQIDWHAIAENPAPEEADAKVNKTYRAIAACASLRDELTDCMEEVAVPAPGITITCNVCRAGCESPGPGRWVRCEACGGERMDRAENAAKNLLRRGLEGDLVDDAARVS